MNECRHGSCLHEAYILGGETNSKHAEKRQKGSISKRIAQSFQIRTDAGVAWGLVATHDLRSSLTAVLLTLWDLVNSKGRLKITIKLHFREEASWWPLLALAQGLEDAGVREDSVSWGGSDRVRTRWPLIFLFLFTGQGPSVEIRSRTDAFRVCFLWDGREDCDFFLSL